MGRVTDHLTVTDALGERHTPRSLLRPTLVLLGESAVLVLLLFAVGVAWEALH
jgi:hypothetical protein